jgi:DnaJ-class molecular chaperone
MHTCEQCNGLGIINYDSDLPRWQQETCDKCGGEGVTAD